MVGTGLNDTLFWTMVGVQVLGLGTAFGTRVVRSSHSNSYSRYLFLLFMCLLGAGTIAMVTCGSSHWTSPGASLCGMLLAATWSKNP